MRYESTTSVPFKPTLFETVWESPQMDYFCAEVGERLIIGNRKDGSCYVRTTGEESRRLGSLSLEASWALKLNQYNDSHLDVRVHDRGIHDECIWYEIAISAHDGTDLKTLVESDGRTVRARAMNALKRRAEGDRRLP